MSELLWTDLNIRESGITENKLSTWMGEWNLKLNFLKQMNPKL